MKEPARQKSNGVKRTPDSTAATTGDTFGSAHRWHQTQAEVVACHHEFASMNELTLGMANDSNRFLICFTYHARGRSFSDEFTSPVAMPQGKKFPISYDPLDPQRNRQSMPGSKAKAPVITIGIVGSIVLLLLYFTMMRGCS